MIKSSKLVPRPLDEGPRPKTCLIEAKPTWHGWMNGFINIVWNGRKFLLSVWIMPKRRYANCFFCWEKIIAKKTSAFLREFRLSWCDDHWVSVNVAIYSFNLGEGMDLNGTHELLRLKLLHYSKVLINLIILEANSGFVVKSSSIISTGS